MLTNKTSRPGHIDPMVRAAPSVRWPRSIRVQLHYANGAVVHFSRRWSGTKGGGGRTLSCLSFSFRRVERYCFGEACSSFEPSTGQASAPPCVSPRLSSLPRTTATSEATGRYRSSPVTGDGSGTFVDTLRAPEMMTDGSAISIVAKLMQRRQQIVENYMILAFVCFRIDLNAREVRRVLCLGG
jgi:hypothetical protein